MYCRRRNLWSQFLVYLWLTWLGFFASVGSLANDESISLLKIEPTILDFGRVNEAKHLLDLSFSVKNVSNVPVEIASISSSCGCTTVGLSQRTLKSGESISVPVKVTVSGRKGVFEKDVLINVVGCKESIVVPIKGRIIQDVWFDKPMVQCFAKESETTVEKTFEIRTVDWPSIQFDWKLIDKDLQVEEISRVKENDETVITFRVRMEVPLDQSTVSRHLVLVPLDKRIKQLIVPVVCYRALSKSRRQEILNKGNIKNAEIEKTSMELSPRQFNLGLVAYGDEQRFDITGHPELLGTLKMSGHEHLPQGTIINSYYDGDVDANVLTISVHLGETLKSGLVRGTIYLQSTSGNKYAVDIIGLMGPKNGERTKE